MDEEKIKYWIRMYSVFAILTISAHYLLNLKLFLAWADYLPFLKKLTLSLFLISVILLIGKIIERIIISQAQIEGDRYNLLRIIRLLSLVFILIVVASFLFQNLYGAVVSFGLISLVLGFALQAPITSFIAWLYIVFRRPYQVGNRIQINGLRGDVIEISYLDTIIWECSGDYLGNDRRSGRIIHFPNSLILKEEVINYSGPQVPFIWNETAIQISYTSDLQFVEQCLLQAAVRDFKEKYAHSYAKNEQKWEPAVYFRVNTYAWMEAVISYPVEPEDTTGRRNRILRYALPMLNNEPQKVGFPEGALR